MKQILALVMLAMLITMIGGSGGQAMTKCKGPYTHTGGLTERMGITHDDIQCEGMIIIRCKTMHTTYCWLIDGNGDLNVNNTVIGPPEEPFVSDTLLPI